MEQSVKLWHMIIAALGVIIVCATMVYKSGGSEAAQNIKIEYLQKQVTEITVNMTIDRKESKERDDRAMDKLQNIELLLKDKQDRQ